MLQETALQTHNGTYIECYRKISETSMGDSLSVILSDCFMNEMERDLYCHQSQNSTFDSLMTPTGEERKMNHTSYFSK